MAIWPTVPVSVTDLINMARISLAALLLKITTLFADNTNGDISEGDLREVSTDIKDSFTHLDEHEAHANDTGNPHNVTKSQVGLGNCDDTSDADKPISDATAAALANKLEAADIARKQGVAPAAKSGTTIQFNETAVYGTFLAPETGNLTADFTDLQLGTVVIVCHKTGAEPTYGAQFKKLTTSATYDSAKVNYIKCTLVTANRILFEIKQEL
jgi:hypothetical protein